MKISRNILSIVRAISVLRTLHTSSKIEATEKIIQHRGDKLTLYIMRPKNKKSRSFMVFGHGLTLEGARDRRIQNFAAGMAASGVNVVIPDLIHAKSLKLVPETEDQFEKAVSFTLDELGGESGRLGLLGVSYLGTLCLRIAGQKRFQDHVHWLATLGAYASFDHLWNFTFSPMKLPYAKDLRVQASEYLRNIFENNLPSGSTKNDVKIPKGFQEAFSLQGDANYSRNLKVLLTHSLSDNIVPVQEMYLIEEYLRAKGLSPCSRVLNLPDHARLSSWNENLQLLRVIGTLLELASR